MSNRKKTPLEAPSKGPRLRTVLIAALVLLGIVLLLLNWRALSASIEVNLLVVRFEAPLGLLVVTLVSLAGLAFVAFFARLEAATLRNDRKILIALQSLEEAVEQGQASTTEQLASVTEELRRLRQGGSAPSSDTERR